MSLRDMEATFYLLKIIFFCVSMFFIPTFSSSLDAATSPDDPSANQCVLNFTLYPYKPTGNCLYSYRETKTKQWDSLITNLCCQNALTTFSQALALHAITTQSNIFLKPDIWGKCSGPFLRQQTVSWASCEFSQLYDGSNKCSTLTLITIKQQEAYQNALQACSHFDNQFNEVCNNCAGAVMDLRDQLLEILGIKDNDHEKGVCGVASVIALASERLNNRSITDDFFGCLNALDKFIDPDYIRLKRSLVSSIFAVAISIVILMILIVVINYVSKKKPIKAVRSRQITNTWTGLYRFSKAEIENAISFGNEKKCLGRGSAGEVYKGVLPSGQIVAIKHINKHNKSDSFAREVEGLSRVRHPNLVCLFGCCVEDGEKYLVYEYCSYGNLAQNLLKRGTLLTWERRVKILRDCALALRYLHNFIDGCIVHRDIKLTNILLTEDLEPKLSDFGLAKMLGMEETKVFTDVIGTIGYMDPEYMSNAHLTCASDIYSFGIVMLQLLSGQKVIELELDDRDQLTRKAKDVNMGKRPISDFEDPRLKGDVNEADFISILQVAVLCVANTSIGRPTIAVVFAEMDKAWKNTMAYKNAKHQGMSTSSATPMSSSMEFMPV